MLRGPTRLLHTTRLSPPTETWTIRVSSVLLRWHASGSHHDLDTAVLLVIERREALRRVSQLQPVRHDKTRINVAVLNPFEQRFEIALRMRLSRFEGQCLVHHR